MCAKMTGRTEDLAVVGIDIGKDSFNLVGFDRAGQLVVRKKIKRFALTATFEQLPRCVAGLEACLSAHFVSRILNALEHDANIRKAQARVALVRPTAGSRAQVPQKTAIEFGERLSQAVEAYPSAPTTAHGRLSWLQRELKKHGGVKVSVNMVHTWMHGLSRPRDDNLRALARLL